MHPLPVVPEIGLFDQPAVRAGGGVDPRLRQGSEHGLQFGAEGTGEAEGAGPGSVSAAVELDMAPVVVELFFGSARCRGGYGGSPCATRMRSSVTKWMSANPTSSCCPFVDVSRVEAAPVNRGEGPFDDRHLLRAHPPRLLRRREMGLPSGKGVGRACWSAHPPQPRPSPRRDASPGDSRSTLINTRIIEVWVSASGRSRDSASLIKEWSIERDAVPRPCSMSLHHTR